MREGGSLAGIKIALRHGKSVEIKLIYINRARRPCVCVCENEENPKRKLTTRMRWDDDGGWGRGDSQGARTRVWGKPKPRQKLHFINGGLQLVARRAEKKSRNLIQCELFISCQKGAGAWIIPPTFDGSKAEGKAGGSTDDTIQWVRKYFLFIRDFPSDFHSPTRTRLYAHNWIVLLHFTSSLNLSTLINQTGWE